MLILLINKQKGFRRGKVYSVSNSSHSTWTLLNHEKKETRVSKASCIIIVREAGLPLSKWGDEYIEALKDAFFQGYEVDRLISCEDNDFVWEICEHIEDFKPEGVYRSLGVPTPRVALVTEKKLLQRISDLKNQLKTLQGQLNATTEDNHN